MVWVVVVVGSPGRVAVSRDVMLVLHKFMAVGPELVAVALRAEEAILRGVMSLLAGIVAIVLEEPFL